MFIVSSIGEDHVNEGPVITLQTLAFTVVVCFAVSRYSQTTEYALSQHIHTTFQTYQNQFTRPLCHISRKQSIANQILSIIPVNIVGVTEIPKGKEKKKKSGIIVILAKRNKETCCMRSVFSTLGNIYSFAISFP